MEELKRVRCELRQQGGGTNIQVDHADMHKAFATLRSPDFANFTRGWLTSRQPILEQSELDDPDGYGALLTALRSGNRYGAFGGGFCGVVLSLCSIRESNVRLGFQAAHAALKAIHPAYDTEESFERLLLWFGLLARAWPHRLVRALAMRAGCYYGLPLAVSALTRGFLSSESADELVRVPAAMTTLSPSQPPNSNDAGPEAMLAPLPCGHKLKHVCTCRVYRAGTTTWTARKLRMR